MISSIARVPSAKYSIHGNLGLAGLSTGHLDPKRAANAKLHCDMAGFNVSKVFYTLQPTSICSRTQSVMIGATNRPAWQRCRQHRAAQTESQAFLMEGRATTPEVVVMSPRKITTPVTQHQALVRRMPKQPTSQTPVVATTMAALVCASLAQGPAWDEARLLVDSDSEHPPLSSTRMAGQLGLEGQVVSAATQANGEILPLSDVGCLQVSGLPVTESFYRSPSRTMISSWESLGCTIIGVLWTMLMINCGNYCHQGRFP